ncbi:hypothetical protein [Actinomycetospora chiangmaiensis]|uniref:hypothetical protein n=1 Tax=Actinomycetospora chiangmaiensis TaxID=402650 RepID=UPI000371EEE2|nr:hypothetical protein [Actinomycetospora chiangmaiensis]
MDGTGFIGSMVEAGEGVLLLRGALPADVGARVREHLDDLLGAGVRHVRVDAREAVGVDEQVLRALTAAQDRLAPRRGMVSIVGLDVAGVRATVSTSAGVAAA